MIARNQNLFNNAVISPIIFTINANKPDNASISIKEILSDREKSNFVNQDSYLNVHDFTFRIGWNVHKQEIIEQIQAKSFPLCELCYISWGAQPGDAKKFIFNSPNQVDPNYRKYLKPLIRGGSVNRYCISYSGQHLLYLIDGDLKLHRPAFTELFESEKIVIPEVTATKRIIATIDNEGFYTNHSVINCINKKDLAKIEPDIMSSRGIKIVDIPESTAGYKWHEDELAYTRGCCVNKDSKFNNISLKYALSIINSGLISFYFKNYLSGDLNVFPGLVKFLPVFDINLTVNKDNDTEYYENLIVNNEFEKIQQLMEKAIQEDNCSDIHELFSLISNRLIHLKKSLRNSDFLILDNIADNAIYKLYGFNENQTAYIKNEINS